MSHATEVVPIVPNVGIGELRLGMPSDEIGRLYRVPVLPTGFSKLGNGCKVHCFDGELVSITLHTNDDLGQRGSPENPFLHRASTDEGLVFGASYSEVLEARPEPRLDELLSIGGVPVRDLFYDDGLRLQFDPSDGSMRLLLLAGSDIDKPIHVRMHYFGLVEDAVWSADYGAMESLRDIVCDHELTAALASLYPELPSWDTRTALLLAVQDRIVPEWKAAMAHFLHAPFSVADWHETIHIALVVAACHLDGSFDRFDDYWSEPGPLHERIAELTGGL